MNIKEAKERAIGRVEDLSRLTLSEYGMMQYLCECIAYGETIDLSDDGVAMAKRMSQVLSNAILSEDNQVEVTPRVIEESSWVSILRTPIQ